MAYDSLRGSNAMSGGRWTETPDQKAMRKRQMAAYFQKEADALISEAAEIEATLENPTNEMQPPKTDSGT